MCLIVCEAAWVVPLHAVDEEISTSVADGKISVHAWWSISSTQDVCMPYMYIMRSSLCSCFHHLSSILSANPYFLVALLTSSVEFGTERLFCWIPSTKWAVNQRNSALFLFPSVPPIIVPRMWKWFSPSTPVRGSQMEPPVIQVRCWPNMLRKALPWSYAQDYGKIGLGCC